MELVYLWVEDYKNIHNQGFNFSSKFICDYDEDKKELTIEDNPEHIPNFFGKNINVTAIVGKNGSGKSSVLSGINKDNSVIKINKKLFTKSFKNIKSDIKIERTYIEEEYYDILYLDFDLIKINPIDNFVDYLNWNIYDKNLYTAVENGILGDKTFNIHKFRENFYNLIIKHNNSFKSNIFLYNPQEIILFDCLHETKSTEPKWVKINQFIKETKDKHFTKEKFLVFLFSNISSQVDLKLPIIEKIKDLFTHEKIILEHSKYLKIENEEKIYSFFDALNSFENKSRVLIKDFIPLYEVHKEAFLMLINSKYLQTNFSDSRGREYFDLSQGERKLFTEFLMIYDAIKKNEIDNILLLLDEPDLTLHPEWQKKYIQELINLVSNFPEKNFHLLFTTHSPFLLSDIPKQNIIFLDKYNKDDEKVKNGIQKEGNSKVVDGLKQTFGANIHTLLSDSFFMKGGLMGEFAKGKISEIKKFYEKVIKEKKTDENIEFYDKHQKNFWQIQKIIGEPFLQRVIGNYLDELELIFSDDNTLIQKELDEIEERKNYLLKLKEESHNDRN